MLKKTPIQQAIDHLDMAMCALKATSISDQDFLELNARLQHMRATWACQQSTGEQSSDINTLDNY